MKKLLKVLPLSYLWHALRAMGFDFKKIGQAFDNIENTKITQN